MPRRSSKGKGGSPKRPQNSGRVPFTRGFGESLRAQGVNAKNMRFSDQKPRAVEHQTHAGKKSKSHAGRITRPKGEWAGKGRMGERFAAKILTPENYKYEKAVWRAQRFNTPMPPAPQGETYIRTAPANPGIDFISRDGSVRIEVKGTNKTGKRHEDGTFPFIATHQGALKNYGANQFWFVTPKQLFIADGDKLREYVQRNYNVLPKRQAHHSDTVFVKLTIKKLIRAGVFATPMGNVQGWMIHRGKGEVKGGLANKMPTIKKPVPLTRAQIEREHEFEEHPYYEGRGKRQASRKRGSGFNKRRR